jgi:protein-arginine kinase activator protein McsA
MNFLWKKPKKRCIVCDVIVGNSPAHIRYKYIEDDEAKIATAYLCEKCADDIEQSKQVEKDDDNSV